MITETSGGKWCSDVSDNSKFDTVGKKTLDCECTLAEEEARQSSEHYVGFEKEGF